MRLDVDALRAAVQAAIRETHVMVPIQLCEKAKANLGTGANASWARGEIADALAGFLDEG